MSHQTIDAILGVALIGAIRAATSITCELLDPGSVEPAALTSPRNLDPGQCSKLKGLLLDPHSWFFARKRCLPRHTAMFHLSGQQGNVSVLVGFPCADWIVTGPNERRGGFFDPVADQVRALLKSIFAEYASPNPRSLWRSGVIWDLRSRKK